jgi:oligopeptide/dipeptide ABC transporter ATP-binding protein
VSSPSNSGSVLEVRDLRVYFRVKGSKNYLKAVDGVSVSVERAKSLGIVGESGSGKTTLGKAALKLVRPRSGAVLFEGRDVYRLRGGEEREFRKKVQMVFQDPFDATDPLYSVYDTVAEGIRILHLAHTRRELDERVHSALESVALTPPEAFVHRRITSLSGGQRQRVAIARVLAMDPEAIILDEPVSMLDASVRGEIMSIMNNLKSRGKTFMMITHDIATLKFFADDVTVMYLGKIMEQAPVADIVKNPLHPYTQALIAAVPVPDPNHKVKSLAKGEIPSPLNPPSGCPFHPRCPIAQSVCAEVEPELRSVGPRRLVACHFA